MITKTTKEFTEAYKKLNKEQLLAVDTIDGPVMVVAGPGTGKTQTIALRMANILRQTDTNPDAVLALTFTESGARAMRTRLAQMIGVTAYYCHISTFHSFCIEVIKDNPDRFTLDPSAEPLSQLEKLKIIYRLLDSTPLTYLRPIGAPALYVKAILASLSDLKREGVDSGELTALLDAEDQFLHSNEAQELKKTEFTKRLRDLAKNRELKLLYDAYQQELKQTQRFDFEDMINTVVSAFRSDHDLLSIYQERFQYFLVDEYQDTNSAQNELLLLLAGFWGDKANIFVTGDPDQCLPGDTLVTTENGDTQIQNIRIGDKVLSAVGKGYTSYVPVTNTFTNHRLAKMITLTLETGQVITSTHNHKMFCYLPPREQSNYWYVYLMFKKGLGWRIGTTIGLSHRLKLEADADKIVGIKQCDSEAEAKYFEIVYSLKYQIPTVIFKFRNNMISGEWLTRLYKEFDTVTNANKLASELGINLDEPHYQRDGTTFGKGRTKINLYMNSRSYRSKYATDGLLKSPSIEHELNIQTKNPAVLRILKEKGFKLRNQHIGKGFRLVSHDLHYLYQIGKELEGELDGILDIKSSLGTHAIQHKPTRIMQAGNVLVGNYLPVRVGNHIEYSKVIRKTEKFEKITTYDLEVYPSHNFIAGGVVVHNSIMRFQGASIENQLSFIKVYPRAAVITLKQNYRSTQTILDAADSLISHNNLRISDVVPGIDSHLIALGEHQSSPIYLASLSSSTAETIFLAQDIKAKLKSGVSPSQIAIIYRTNRESDLIASTLVKYGIDYSVQGGANVLEDPTVRNFLKILRVIYQLRHKDDDRDLFTILHYDIFGIDSLDVLKISRLASDLRLNLFEILAAPSHLDSLTLSSRPHLVSALKSLAAWQQLDANSTFVDFFDKVLNDSGYLKWVLKQPDSHHRLSRLNTLFDEVKRMNRFDHHLDLSAFIANLDLMEENNLRLEESEFGISQDAVTLTTAHSAKGLEWEHVYLYRSVDKHWGNNQVKNLLTFPEGVLKNVKLGDKERNEDERRLFYVAMTRAKSGLTISQASSYSSSGTERGAVPSMFLSELGDLPAQAGANLEPLDTQAIEDEAHAHLEKLLTTTPDSSVSASTKDEQAFLRPLVDNFSLSVTALNTYLECAYKFKLDKLFRVPRAKKSHLAFGTAIHSALEHFYSQLKDTGSRPSLDFLLDAFHTAIARELITKEDLSIRLAQGDKLLSAYYLFHRDDFKEPIFLEKFSRVQLGDITLTGKIDRIEWLDPSDRTVRVIDYKTGKSKTTGQIEGTTADSQGDLKRQLVFYKLLIDLDRRLQNIKFGEAVLDFVAEPLDKGKDGKRSFQVTEAQLADLRSTISSTMAEIRALHFPRTKDLKVCSTCDFRDHCHPQGIPNN